MGRSRRALDASCEIASCEGTDGSSHHSRSHRPAAGRGAPDRLDRRRPRGDPTITIHRLRLGSEVIWVDARLAEINGRWIASADTPDGPSLGLAWTPRFALRRALRPFDDVIGELLATAPQELLKQGSLR